MAETHPPLLHDKQLLIAETLPEDWGFLDTYQQWAADSVVRDPNGITIRGKQPLAYMLAGLDEEATEVLFDVDRVEPGYNRLGALAMIKAGDSRMDGGHVTETAVGRHRKEFGDVAWYATNTLTLCGLRYSQTIIPGLAAIRLKQAANIATGRGTAEFHDYIERHAAGIFLYPGAISQLRVAAHALARPASGRLPADTFLKRRDERGPEEERLIIAIGTYTILAQHVLRTRFDTTYKNILEGNIAKLSKRRENDVLFDKTGGDDR